MPRAAQAAQRGGRSDGMAEARVVLAAPGIEGGGDTAGIGPCVGCQAQAVAFPAQQSRLLEAVESGANGIPLRQAMGICDSPRRCCTRNTSRSPGNRGYEDGATRPCPHRPRRARRSCRHDPPGHRIQRRWDSWYSAARAGRAGRGDRATWRILCPGPADAPLTAVKQAFVDGQGGGEGPLLIGPSVPTEETRDD